MKIKQNLTAILLAGALTFSPSKTFSQVNGSLTTKLKSDCVFSILGSIPGKGPHMQNTLSLNAGRVSFYSWLNTDLGNKMNKEDTYNEFDFGISYTQPIEDHLSLSVGENGFMWEGNSTYCPSAEINYSDKANFNLSWYHLFEDKKLGIPDGDALIGKVSKNFPVGKSLTFTPSFYSIYVNTFFGKNTGNAANVLGGKISYKNGNAVLSGSLNNQWKGNVKNNSSIRDQFFWDLGLSVDF